MPRACLWAKSRNVLTELAPLRGQSEKSELVRKLLVRARPAEVKYIVKIMTGDLRIGLRESLVEEAVAKAYERPIAAVRRANMLLGDIGETLQCAFRNELETVRFRLFHPIDFMLATPAENAAEIFKNAPEAMVVEEKYDGIRAQAHKSGNRVKIFSRTLDEVVEFPELSAPLAALPGEYIVDGEILAWHGDQPLPFTQLQKRLGRKTPDLSLAPGDSGQVRALRSALPQWRTALGRASGGKNPATEADSQLCPTKRASTGAGKNV